MSSTVTPVASASNPIESMRQILELRDVYWNKDRTAIICGPKGGPPPEDAGSQILMIEPHPEVETASTDSKTEP